jgi:hypothetical protein
VAGPYSLNSAGSSRTSLSTSTLPGGTEVRARPQEKRSDARSPKGMSLATGYEGDLKKEGYMALE